MIVWLTKVKEEKRLPPLPGILYTLFAFLPLTSR